MRHVLTDEAAAPTGANGCERGARGIGVVAPAAGRLAGTGRSPGWMSTPACRRWPARKLTLDLCSGAGASAIPAAHGPKGQVLRVDGAEPLPAVAPCPSAGR